MFLIQRDQPLDELTLGSIINQFMTTDFPKLQNWKDYYDGKQKILQKEAIDGKPCNKVVTNFVKEIVANYNGYITGVPIAYSNAQDKNFSAVLDVLKYNDVTAEDSGFLKNALIYGKAFEINYIDEDAKQRFKLLDPRECIDVYDNTLNNNLMYVIRFYKENLFDENLPDTKYIVEVYDDTSVKIYRSTAGFSSFELIDQRIHYYDQVPVTVFTMPDQVPIFYYIKDLQDAYNETLSFNLDDIDALANAYLVLKGAIPAEEDLKKMKTNRILVLDADANAEWLVKQINNTQIENMLENTEKKIHEISNSPDFTAETFNASSGISLRLKLIGFENQAAEIEQEMRKALTKRIELIAEILKLTDIETIWREVEITFTRNLPIEEENIATMVNSLRGLVSEKTLLKLLPFVADVDEELKQLNAEREQNAELYRFDNQQFEDFGINE